SPKLPAAALGRRPLGCALARCLLGGCALDGLLGCALARCLLDCCALHGLLGGCALDGLLGCALARCLLGCCALHGLLGHALTRRLLSRRPPHCLLGHALTRRLLGSRTPDGLLRYPLTCAAGARATLHCWTLLWKTLRPRHNGLELSARPECRNRRRLHSHRFAGARIACHTRRATALFENTEPGNRDAVTLVHRAHDGVDNVFYCFRCLPTI